MATRTSSFGAGKRESHDATEFYARFVAPEISHAETVARRIGHPAPFPVELPERLLRPSTYRGDVVLDPFMGSGSTAIATRRNDRRYVGYDTDPDDVELARSRLAEEGAVPSS